MFFSLYCFTSSPYPFLWRLAYPLLSRFYLNPKLKGMKTLLTGCALLLFSTFSFAQESKTSLNNITVVSTSAGMAAQLTWKKGSENVAFYVVERSYDGIDFKQCAIVFLSDNPDFTEYKFRDKIASHSNGFLYRIGIVNEQKRVSYLPIRKLISPESL